MVTAKELTQIPVIYQKLQEFESEDSRFVQVRIWLMHTGENHNGSYFSKEVVEKAIPTLANTPVVAYMEENSQGAQDFSDHRMVLHRTEDGEFNLKYMGVAIGIIPESNNAHWEKRVADDGIEREYLVVDALLWTKWEDAIDIMKNKEGKVSQSMELSDQYSGFLTEDNLFHFEKFSFNGACLLGEDYLPAMEGSTAEVMFNKDIHKNIEEKLSEFYTTFSKEISQEGGNATMANEKHDEEVKVEDVKTEATEFEQNQPQDEPKPEEKKDDIPKEDDAPESAPEAPEKDAVPETDPEQPIVTEDAPEQSNEPEVPHVEDAPKVEDEPNFQEQYEEAKRELDALKAEVDQLRDFKRTTEENALREKFSEKVSEEEFAQVFESMKDADIEEVEEKIFAIYGKKNFSIEPKKESKEVNKAFVAPVKEDHSPYGGLLQGFEKKS